MSQQIVLAMANQNSLAFTLNFDSMPAQIRNQVVTGEVHSHSTASDVPQPPESQQAPGDVAPSTTVAAGPTLNKQAQIRLLGLTMGVSASLLTGPNAEHAVQEQLTSTLLDPNVSTDIKQALKRQLKVWEMMGWYCRPRLTWLICLIPKGISGKNWLPLQRLKKRI